jgi:hypothetical protein
VRGAGERPCEALGETLTNRDPLDLDIIRLGKLEAADFRAALNAAEPAPDRRHPRRRRRRPPPRRPPNGPRSPGRRRLSRSQAFGLFFGLPGRCEHAARRIRAGITTPPATPRDVGLESVGEEQAQ